MIPHLRARFNAVYSEERYPALLQTLTAHFGEAPAFRVSETPIFVPNNLARQLLEACEEISDVLCRPDFKELTEPALHRPPSQAAPGEDDHPLFLQYDFAVTLDEMGRFVPYLIEMQGFPSLYFYQHMLALAYRECYDIPASLRHLFGGLDHEEYLNLLNEAIVAGHDPDHVVLLEVEPQLQKTRVDFWSAQRLLGIKTLCLSELKREGRDLYYLDAYQKRVPVRRIFNRVIFDELIKREELPRQFNLVEEVDVEWAGHPNWFSRVSKFVFGARRTAAFQRRRPRRDRGARQLHSAAPRQLCAGYRRSRPTAAIQMRNSHDADVEKRMGAPPGSQQSRAAYPWRNDRRIVQSGRYLGGLFHRLF
jgi:hypothetical protein